MKPGRRRFLLGLGCVVAALVAGRAYVGSRGHALLADALAEGDRQIRDQGPRLRPAILAPTEAGDASEVYRELLSKEPLRDTSDVRTYDMWFWPSEWDWDTVPEKAPPPWVAGVVDRVLSLAHRALADPIPGFVAEIDPDRGSPASYAAFVLTRYALHGGLSPAKSLQFASAALVVVEDWQLFGSGDTWTTPDATLGALRAIETAVTRGARDPQALSVAARILDHIASRPAPARAMATWLAVDTALTAGRAPPGRAHWGSIGSSDPTAKSVGWRWLWSADAANGEFVRRSQAQAAQVLANWDTPPDRLSAAIWGPQICGRAPLGPTHCFEVDPTFLLVRLEGHERLALARAAVALARWAADRGSFPKSLADLVPAYAAEVPRDPMNGKPLGYDGTRVWSVGPDGKDGGGRQIPKTQRYGQVVGDQYGAPDGDEVWPEEEPAKEK